LAKWKSGASDHQKKTEQGKPQGHYTPLLLSLPYGAKYITVTQDTIANLLRKRRDEHLFRRAKTGGLGLVTTKKKEDY